MEGPRQKLEFVLHGTVEGQPITPDNIDLLTLNQFLGEVIRLAGGGAKRSEMGHPAVAFTEGSFKVSSWFPLAIAASFNADMMALRETGNLDEIEEQRATVIDIWQKRAKKPDSTQWYSIPNPDNPEEKQWVKVDSKASFSHHSKNQWVHFEEYAKGTVLHTGGATPNLHLVTSTDTIIIGAEVEQIRAAQCCYEKMIVRFEGMENLVTGERKELQLISAEKEPLAVDGKILRAFKKATTAAWADVDDVPKWLDELRGY